MSVLTKPIQCGRRPAPRSDHRLEVVSRQIKAAGGLEAVAATAAEAGVCGASITQLQRMTDPAETAEISVRLATVLQQVSGQPLILEWMASQLGFALLPLVPVADAPLAANISDTGKRHAEDVETLVSALADGQIDLREARALEQCTYETMLSAQADHVAARQLRRDLEAAQ